MPENNNDAPAPSRAVAVAREYDALMGLTSVVMGAGFLMASIIDPPAVWIALGSAFGAMCPEWYYRRFGFTRPRPRRVVWSSVGVGVVLAAVLVAFVLDRWLAPPVVLSLLAVAAGLGAGQFLMLHRVGLTPVHWAVYAALVVAAFAPMVGVANKGLFTPFVLAVTGAALVVLGLIDHRRLVRAMGPAASVDDGQLR